MKKFKYFLIGIFIISLSSCNDELPEFQVKNNKASLKAINPQYFDWEIEDWMPTPPGQSRIMVPWIGTGSIASIFSNDVIYDMKKSDGWELVYSTFDSSAPGPIENPHFILYNKYRGLLRIYFHLTTPFVQTSSYLQDGVNILGSSSSLLNFCGNCLVDVNEEITSFSQVQPEPKDGSRPLATNKWYMLQYQLAYDPNITELTHTEIQFSWYTNFCDIKDVVFEGVIDGSIKSALTSNDQSNIYKQMSHLGEVSATMGLSALGSKWVEDNTVNSYYGTNDLNLPKESWLSLRKGVNSALSAATGNLPGAIVGVMSGIIGGSSATPTMSFHANFDVDLVGTESAYGSLPSSPTTLYVPGTNIASNAQGYIPLFKKKLGVFNLSARPQIKVTDIQRVTFENRRPIRYWERKITKIDNSSKLIINGDVSSIAQVELVKEDVVFIIDPVEPALGFDAKLESWGKYKYLLADCRILYLKTLTRNTPAVRMTIKVTPNDGSPSSLIVKTFLADLIYN